MNDGSKSNAIAKYCDAFYIVTTKDLITEDLEIPLSWGIMEYHCGKLKQIKRPQKIEHEQLSDAFVAGLLQSFARKENDNYQSYIDKIKKDVFKDFDEAVKLKIQLHDRETKKIDYRSEEVKKFIDIMNKSGTRVYSCDDLLKAVIYGNNLNQIKEELMFATNNLINMRDKLYNVSEIMKKQIKEDENIECKTR